MRKAELSDRSAFSVCAEHVQQRGGGVFRGENRQANEELGFPWFD